MVTISEVITNALRAYRTGNLFEAEWLCQDWLQQHSEQGLAQLLLGAIAHQPGRLASEMGTIANVI